MHRKINASQIGRNDLGWLKSLFHFSFADYYNPDNMRFGALRVINDDLVLPGTGFDWHPHRDMEIISYVLNGEVTHGDTMGNENTIGRGDVQYMSAGSGLQHKEYNFSKETARFLQIWIMPEGRGYKPQYGDKRFTKEQRQDQWLHIASPMAGDAPIRIHQDANLYATELAAGKQLTLSVPEGRQAYLVLAEGEAVVNGETLSARDAMELVEEDAVITAVTDAHVVVVEMKVPGA